MVSKVMVIHFLLLLYITSWKTLSLLYQNLQIFEGSQTEMPFFILGDEACPLKTYLMKPFKEKNLSCDELVFNYRLSRARRCVECAFGILQAKWRLLNKAIKTKVNKAERIVRCICLLHNIIIDLEGITHDQSVQETSQIRGSRQNKCQW